MPGGDEAAVATHLRRAARAAEPPARTGCSPSRWAAGKIQALGNLVVKKQPAAPAVGDRAFASRTPTLASTGGNLKP